MTAADRPSVTDNARAEAVEAIKAHLTEFLVDHDAEEFAWNILNDLCEVGWAAGRAETTTEGTQPGCTGAGDCPAPAHLHGCFADTEGHCNDPDDHPAETTTEATERIARQIARETAMTGTDALELVEAVQALQDAETTTATTEDAETAIWHDLLDTWGTSASGRRTMSPATARGITRHVIDALNERGLLATARTAPTDTTKEN